MILKKRLDLIKTFLNILQLVRNGIDKKHNKWYQEALVSATTTQVNES